MANKDVIYTFKQSCTNKNVHGNTAGTAEALHWFHEGVTQGKKMDSHSLATVSPVHWTNEWGLTNRAHMPASNRQPN